MNSAHLVTLHRYYIWANRLREYFDGALAAHGPLSASDFPIWFADDLGLFLSHWYAALYVVVGAIKNWACKTRGSMYCWGLHMSGFFGDIAMELTTSSGTISMPDSMRLSVRPTLHNEFAT